MTGKAVEPSPEGKRSDSKLEQLLVDARVSLSSAFLAVRGEHGAEEAAAEAIAWGWANADRLAAMENPVGYLYRVGLTRTAARKPATLPRPRPAVMPDVHPELITELLELSENQRAAVWLVHACGWSYGDVAEALAIGTSTVGTHVTRALAALRVRLGDDTSPERLNGDD